jgi:hypothetical protein
MGSIHVDAAIPARISINRKIQKLPPEKEFS